MKSIDVGWANHAFMALGGLFLALHLTILMSYSVNIPMWDEWALLGENSLAKALNTSWLFEFHNEHRIVWTKLQTWLLYRAGGWNLNANVMINFFMYAVFSLFVVKTLQDRFAVPMGFVLVLMSSTLPWYNHYNPFQSQFHYLLIFFFSAVMTAIRSDRLHRLSALFAIAAAYSFSSGIICAAACVGLYLTLAYLRPSMRSSYLMQALLVGIFIGLWFIGFHRSAGHPPFAMPWHPAFWHHYLNTLSAGFGYQGLSMIPGAVLLLTAAGLCLWRVFTLGELTEDQRADYIGVITIIAAILGSIASISMARAAFGAVQAKASHYTEISGFLIPFLWILFTAASRKVPHHAGKFLIAGVVLVLVIPFHDEFKWKRVYTREFEKKLAAQRCVGDYYKGRSDGSCPMTYFVCLKDELDRAKKLKVLFYRELK